MSCHKNRGCYLQGQGHSEGLYNENITVSTILCKLMILKKEDFFAKKLSLVVEHCMSKCPVKVLDC